MAVGAPGNRRPYRHPGAVLPPVLSLPWPPAARITQIKDFMPAAWAKTRAREQVAAQAAS